jgi:transcriptional regulator with XRE-family HTH domain
MPPLRLTFVSVTKAKERKPTPLGERILAALEVEGRTIASAEREAGFSAGHLNRIVYGSRGDRGTLDVARFKRLADLLHVEFEWLVLGVGNFRRGGRGPTAAETAIIFARKNNCREDAIRIAWEENKAKSEVMSEVDWVVEIDRVAKMLDRAGVPRPEVVERERDAIRREARKLETARERVDGGSADEDDDLLAAVRSFAVGL